MSLTDPDARDRRIGSFLEPIAWVLALLALALAPIVDILIDNSIDAGDNSPWFIPGLIGYILITVGFGELLYYTAKHRSGLGIASYCIAYVGGLILILGAEPYKGTLVPQGTIPALVLYGVALLLLIIYITHSVAANATLKDGVETTATVTSAGVNGMVNYVTHWKLTLKFTDQAGKDRWFHIGRTGYGYSVGQEFKIKYNPKNPGSKRGIVVLDG